jgi:membrane-bound lytic murein transglycosylase D
MEGRKRKSPLVSRARGGMVCRVRWCGIILCVGSMVRAIQAEPLVAPTDDRDREHQAKAALATWLKGFGELDRERLTEALGEIRERIRGEYEVDLAPVKQTARMLSMVLRGSGETQTYAAWLDAQYRSWPDRVDFRVGLTAGAPEEKVIHGLPLGEAEVALNELRGAEHFVPRLKPIFESMRVPTELVWVAEVESAFDPRAISPVGAAGLYQLMPATARQYGLVLEPEDDRLHPEKNALAAARHMSYLKRTFNDWPLAMAAYNAGHNRVRGLLAKHNARSFEEIALYLPLETQLFVPKVDATLVRREGVSLARLPSPVP